MEKTQGRYFSEVLPSPETPILLRVLDHGGGRCGWLHKNQNVEQIDFICGRCMPDSGRVRASRGICAYSKFQNTPLGFWGFDFFTKMSNILPRIKIKCIKSKQK